MEKVVWNRELYYIGVEQVDCQHEGLFTLLDSLVDQLNNASLKNKTISTIKELLDYADTHFKTEETLMEKYRYPKTSKHKEEHRSFTLSVLEFYTDYSSGKAELDEKIVEFLTSWVTNHIGHTDKEMGEFLFRNMQ